MKTLIVTIVALFVFSGCTTMSMNDYAQMNNYNGVKANLNAGVNPNRVGGSGYTSLHWAAQKGNANMTQLLLNRQANVHMRDRWGETPLFKSVWKNHQRVSQLLLRAGADVNQRSFSQRTPLYAALNSKSLSNVQMLVENGASLDIVDKNGVSPLAFASTLSIPNIVAFLKTSSHSKSAFASVKQTNTVIAYENFIALYPSSSNIPEAKKLLQLRLDEHKQKVVAYESQKDLQGLQVYLATYPVANRFVSLADIKLLSVGPANFNVAKIKTLLAKDMSELIIISKIKTVERGYKNFEIDEIVLLQEWGFTDKVISTMMDVTTTLAKEQKQKREQARLLEKQRQANQVQQKVIYKTVPAQQQSQPQNRSNPVVDGMMKKAGEKVMESLIDSLF